MRVANLIIVAMVVALLMPAVAFADTLQSPIDGTGVLLPGVFGSGGNPPAVGTSDLVEDISESGNIGHTLSFWGWSSTDNMGGEVEWKLYKDVGDGNFQQYYGGVVYTWNGSLTVTPDATLTGPGGENVNKYSLSLDNVDLTEAKYLWLEGNDYGDSGYLGILYSTDGNNEHYQGSDNLAEWGYGQIVGTLDYDWAIEIDSSPIPEPSTLALLLVGLGFGAFALLRKRN